MKGARTGSRAAGFPTAILGFLVGAAAMAGAGEGPGLARALHALRHEAERVIRGAPPAAVWHPGPGDGLEARLFAVGDLLAAPAGGEGDAGLGRPSHELVDGIRAAVRPRAWDRGSIDRVGATLLVRQTPEVLVEVARYLDALRAVTGGCVTVEARIVRGAPLAGARAGAVLEDPAAMLALPTLFRASVTGIPGRPMVLRDGVQEAVLADLDVEVAKTAPITVPVVRVLDEGRTLRVVARRAGQDALALELELRRAAPDRTHRTQGMARGGTLALPSMSEDGARADLLAPVGRWIVAGGADGRWVLVRARLEPPPGGDR